ncbi:hypothetical protein [Streptomyces sp. NPDC057052]|uniref:hypothetical protein n=1 Tax=Streptomyces sp. NPDC057052 TaxID=3346010 RepID=UPI003627DD70
MAAISVGSVEVDVVPNARNIRQNLQRQIMPAADSVGDELGRVLGRYVSRHLASAVVQGVTSGGRQAQAPAARQGQATGSTFARSFKSRLEAAMASLPEIRLHADSSDAERELYQIRAQMQALRDARIGIDVSTETATAAMAQLQARLDRLSASDADVAVRVDAAAASAQLAAFNAQVNRLDGQTADVDVDVDTRPAIQGFSALVTAAVAFGPAILPVLPVVAAGLGAIAAAGVAAGAGLGAIGLVAIPAFKGIASTLQAQKAAQDAATNATLQGGQAASQAASRSLQLASAQQAVASAERNGARQVAQAQAQVSQARRQAAQVAAQASQRAQQAARAVEDAEDALSDAQKAAARAQRDLTDARRAAALELEDLNNRLTDSVLSQRDAELSLTEATRERDAVLNSATATELEKRRAILAYDQAVQRLKEQTSETKRLKKETAAANRAGVDGSKTVRTAQEQLAAAQESVADKAQAVRDAQADQARQQIESAQSIADAQQRIVDAQANVGVAQEQAAEQAASAARQLQQAQLSAAGGVDQAAIAQAKYRAELAKLTPAARTTMTAYTNLRTAFGDWSKSLQPQVMPIFTRALDGMRRALPGLTPLVKGAADAVKGLQDRASAGSKKPWWRTFKQDLDTSVKPAITGLGVAFGNVFKGIVGVISAFLPHMDDISGGLQDVTKRFADWGTSLRGSSGFERFLSYASEMAPRVWKTLKEVAGAALDIATALAPVGAVVMRVIQGVAEGFSWLAEKAPWLVRAVWAVIVVWGILNAVMALNPFTLIVIGVGLVVAALVWAYHRFDWFRTVVQMIGDAFVWLWKTIIKPYVEFMIAYWTMVGRAALWLWREAIRPAIGLIVAAFKFWWAAVKLYFKGIQVAFTTLVGAVVYMWTGIKDGFKAGWDWVKRWVINPIGTFFTKTIPGWGSTLKDKLIEAFDLSRAGIKTAWDKIKKIAREPVQYVVDVVYNTGIRGVWNAIAGAFGAPTLPKFTFAKGGVMPGYTPGKDVHRFVSPTGGRLELSGGEAIMRPEFTRAVGSNFVNSMNAIARSRGAQGVKAALAPTFGGNPRTGTDTSLRYADGGIFGWIKSAGSALKGAGSAAWNKVKEGASWLKDTLAGSARAGVEKVVDPLLKRFPGMDTSFGKMLRRIPTRMIDTLFGYSKEADKQGGGGLGGPKIQAALRWAKTQNGLPYQWGGNGNPSWDCSGFMSAIESVLRGQKPHRRWSTHAFSGKTAPPGWVYHGNSPFRIGITAAGVGHTAGTLGGTNVESRGGDGVVVGKRARGYNSSLFTDWYGFKPGSYDSGGYLQPGLNLAYNGTGRPEPVFTTAQANALTARATAPTGPARFEGDLFLDSGEFLGRVRGEAQQVMQEGQRQLISTINAS